MRDPGEPGSRVSLRAKIALAPVLRDSSNTWLKLQVHSGFVSCDT